MRFLHCVEFWKHLRWFPKTSTVHNGLRNDTMWKANFNYMKTNDNLILNFKSLIQSRNSFVF
jgi:hypothetical protein